MFRWLDGPGSVFQNPLPGSTNYLNAYNSSGELIREKKGGQRREEASQDDDVNSESPSIGGVADLNLSGNSAIIPEMKADLQPYPENPQFRSEAVLSEALKTEIYNEITVKGLTVREVSERFRVDMNRVGAVIRLKSVEKNWLEEVRLPLLYLPACCQMMRKTKIRLVLKTSPWLEKLSLMPTLPSIPLPYPNPLDVGLHTTPRADL